MTKTDQGYLYVVSNAGCADKDSAHMKVNTEKEYIQTEGLESGGLIESVWRVCFACRPDWQSSKLQVLMWIWSSLMKHWLLCKVKNSVVLPFFFLLFPFFPLHPDPVLLLLSPYFLSFFSLSCPSLSLLHFPSFCFTGSAGFFVFLFDLGTIFPITLCLRCTCSLFFFFSPCIVRLFDLICVPPLSMPYII